MKKQKAMSQMNGQDKTSDKQLNEVEIGNLPEKEFRIRIVKMIQDLRKTMGKMQEMFSKDYSSVSKESTCSAGDPDSIPGLGRSSGEGIGYPLQYSWTSLVAQLVKNPPSL